ncbi:unnamed protein product [Paramecium octaurelia]|uniref:Uncharacterized protein n=1 Tax=Paramecium octaurelia TaxID=43137 RepID=A0A8S1W0Y2_PAROT|nr:unnamed protein product [Paramecium octaurelia]
MEQNKFQINQINVYLLIFIPSTITSKQFEPIVRCLNVYQELSDAILSQNSNIMKCSILDQIDFYYLSQSYPSVNYYMKIKESHYDVDIFVDFYLIGEYINKPINILLDNSLIDQYSVFNDNSVPFCNNLNLAFSLESTYAFSLGIRNIQIIPRQCHESCVGPEKNQCQTCFVCAQLNTKTNECKCLSITPQLSLQVNQFIRKCEVNEYFDGALGICAQDYKMEQFHYIFGVLMISQDGQ